jgi:hypothetical protein
MTQEAMPVGKGTLGAAVWTRGWIQRSIQSSRYIFPRHLSAGQLVVPSLAKLASASDFSAKLDM